MVDLSRKIMRLLKLTYLFLFLIGSLSIIGIGASIFEAYKSEDKVEHICMCESNYTLTKFFKTIILKKNTFADNSLFENFSLENEIEIETEFEYPVFISDHSSEMYPYFLVVTNNLYKAKSALSEHLDIFSPPPNC